MADRARIRGAESASTWFVIVGDFASAENRAFQHDVWPLLDSLYVRPGRLRVAWVNLPDDASKASQLAAEVAACSGISMKFWPVHDIFLSEQFRWRQLADPTSVLLNLVDLRGGNNIVVNDCLKKHTVQQFLQNDVARARGAGIRKAPGFILGNQVLTGVHTPDEFRAAIDRALPRTK